MLSAEPRETYRFLEFELDVSAYELRRLGVPVKLERQPMDLLILLVEHRQQLVTRAAIIDRLWGKDVFIEVETGINTAVRKIRQALGDSSGASACVETVPGKGYRFIAPVTMAGAETDATLVSRASASAADRAPSADAAPVAAEDRRTHSAPTPAASQPARTTGADRWRRTLVALAVAAIAILAVAGAWLFSGSPTSDVPSMQLIQLTAMSGSENWPSFSPDGRQVAFAWNGEKRDNWDIYVKLVGSSDVRRLTTDGGWDFAPSWSPDGRQIAYVRSMGPRWGDPLRARVMSSLGGADREVGDTSVSLLVRWSPDGRYLVAGRGATTGEGHRGLGIFLIPVDGGDTRAITTPSAPGADMAPAFSPDGHRLAYASCQEPTQQMLCDVRVVEVDAAFSAAGPSRRLTRRPHRIIRGLTWSRDGQFVVYDGEEATLNYLWRVDADGSRPPERIDLAGFSAWFPAADPAGERIAFGRVLNDADIYSFEAGGPARPVAQSSVFDGNPQFSPDGQRIAFCSARSGRMDVWVADADGTDPQQLTHGPGGWQCGPTWSPDGQRIAFDSQAQDESWHIWTVDIRGGTPQQITRSAGDQNMPTWSHDGAWIYFSWMQGKERDIWRTRVATAEQQRLTHGGGGWVGRESSDGSTVFYESRLRDAPLFAQLLAGGPPRQLAGCVTGTAFSSTTAGIYYMPCSQGRERDGLAPVRLLNPATGDDREVARLDSYHYSSVPSGFAVSPDGRTILYSRLVSAGADLMMIDHFK